MGTVVPFPRERSRLSTSGVRIAYVADRWCVERLAGGVIVHRIRMLTQADAERVAGRISRRDKVALLPSHLRQDVDVLLSSHSRPDGTAA